MKTMLDNQQKVNEAVKEITDYFMHVTYEDDLELMFSAQTQIVADCGPDGTGQAADDQIARPRRTELYYQRHYDVPADCP